MRIRWSGIALFGIVLAGCPAVLRGRSLQLGQLQGGAGVGSGEAEQARKSDRKAVPTAFRTSDRCVACHNGLTTSEGEDISIGFQWRASLMANSSRDPYWQGSVRRESMDHPEFQSAIEDECSNCHMPTVHLADRDAGRKTQVFSHLPLQTGEKRKQEARAAADGVTCSVCHQIENTGLGTDATFNGNVVIAKAVREDLRPEYGPFEIDHGHQTVMHSSTGGYLPQHGDQVRDSGLCGSCHTLYTEALGQHGEKLGKFPEQMPFKEWQHSDYESKETCQSCHMPVVNEAVAVTALYGQKRLGMHRHVFVGANFVMEEMLQDHRDELGVEALPQEMDEAMKRTAEFLKTKAAKVSIQGVEKTSDGIAAEIVVENLGGHKLPTAYPSRRAWLHVTVTDGSGRVVFESGALKPDGSIAGNANDEDPLRFSPHYREISRPEEVEIYEDILGDAQGHVTTGLLNAVRYLKDNRVLPRGFDKTSADKDIAVIGEAAGDPAFTGGQSRVRYVVSTGSSTGPFRVQAELMYQPIGFRWAHNLQPYQAAEPQRFFGYFASPDKKTAQVLASAWASP